MRVGKECEYKDEVVKAPVSRVIMRRRKTPVAGVSEACNLILSAHKQSLIR